MSRWTARANRAEPTDLPRLLEALPPDLVRTLARLSGASQADIETTLQLLGFGSRSALESLKLVRIEDGNEPTPALVRIEPLLLDLIESAARNQSLRELPDEELLDAELAHEAERTESEDQPIESDAASGELHRLTH